MVTLLIVLVLTIPAAFFATQNRAEVAIRFFSYNYPHIPLYMVVIISLFAGALLAWAISLLNSFSASLILKQKEKALKEQKQKSAELMKRLHQTEIQNAELKAKYMPEQVDEKSL